MSDLPSTAGPGRGDALDDSRAGEPRQVVQSADQVPLHLPVAGPTSRMFAYLVDALIIFFVALAVLVLLVLLTPLLARLLEPLQRLAEGLGAGGGDPSDAAALLVLVALLFVFMGAEMSYFLFWECTNRGRSPGKALLGLRVVRDGGRPLDFTASLIRNLLRAVDYLPANYLTGFISMLASPEGKRLGDLAAGTVVVRLARSEPLAPLGLDPGAEAASPFRFERAQIGRLGRAERALLRRTLRRVGRLAPEQADAALARAVAVLCARIGYEEPVEPRERQAFLRALLAASMRR